MNPLILPSGAALAHQYSVTNGASALESVGLENVVKKEDLAGIMERFTQQIASILHVKTQNSGNYINFYSNRKRVSFPWLGIAYSHQMQKVGSNY